MSKHRDEFNLTLPIEQSLQVCRAAVMALGWRILEMSEQRIACDEGAYQMGSITYPAQVEILLASGVAESTNITLNGSIFGFGPIQSGHLKKEMQQLRNTIIHYASWPVAAPPTQASATASNTRTPPHTPTRSVIINAVQLSETQLNSLEQQFRQRIPDGNYWYDRISGAWGAQGGPTVGFTLPGLELGGPLRADASNGNTRVFVNGRELHYMELLGLQQLISFILPGRYWVDAQGNAGYEGGPPLCNLFMLAQSASHQGGGVWRNYGDGSGAYRNSNVGIGFISDGDGNMLITN